MELFPIYLMLIFLEQCSGQSVLVNVPLTFIPGTNSLTITCSPAKNNVKQFNAIPMYFNRSANSFTETQVATTYFDQNKPGSVVDKGPQYIARQGVTATGTVNPVDSAQLSVTISADSTTCNDAGNYRCKATGQDNNNNNFEWDGDGETTAEVQPTVGPTLVVHTFGIKSFPKNTDNTRYKVGTVITMTCSGEIGEWPDVQHRWCWKIDYSDVNKQLSRYPSNSHMTQGTPIKSGCLFTRTSTLTHYVTAADTNTMFSCEVPNPQNGLMCGSGFFSANVTIRNYGVQDQSNNNNIIQYVEKGINGWIIAGIIIGVLVFTACVVFLVWYLDICKRLGLMRYAKDNVSTTIENVGVAQQPNNKIYVNEVTFPNTDPNAYTSLDSMQKTDHLYCHMSHNNENHLSHNNENVYEDVQN